MPTPESQREIDQALEQINKPIDNIISRAVVESGERRTLIGTVPLSHVVTDYSLIDESHVNELAQSIKNSDRGQISPTTVRARLDEGTGEVVYDVVDGFHRTEALRRNGAETARVSAMYNCSDEEMYDLRILAAQSVQSVQYARVVTWMREAFKSTPWAEKGVDVTRAFGVTLNDSKRVQSVDLPPEEVTDMKDWVHGTAKRWNKGVGSTYQTLKLVDDADPKLVEQVRTQGGGKDRKPVISPTLLKTTVEAFPGVDNFGIQNAILATILDKRYYVPEARSFIDQATPYLQEGMTKEEALSVIAEHVDLSKVGVVFAREKKKQTSDQKRDVSGRHRKSLQEARGQMAVLKGRVADQSKTIEGLHAFVPRLQEENSALKEENTGLKTRVAELELQLKAQTTQLQTVHKNGNGAMSERSESRPLWWENKNLSPWHAEVLKEVFLTNGDLVEFVGERGKSMKDLTGALQDIVGLRLGGNGHISNSHPQSPRTSGLSTPGISKKPTEQNGHSDRISLKDRVAAKNNGKKAELTPEQIQARVMAKFNDVRLPIMVAGFFLKNEEYITAAKCDSLNEHVVDDLMHTFDTSTSIPKTVGTATAYEGRVEGLEILKLLADLPESIRTKIVELLPHEVVPITQYGIYLNERNVLGPLLGLAKEQRLNA